MTYITCLSLFFAKKLFSECVGVDRSCYNRNDGKSGKMIMLLFSNRVLLLGTGILLVIICESFELKKGVKFGR